MTRTMYCWESIEHHNIEPWELALVIPLLRNINGQGNLTPLFPLFVIFVFFRLLYGLWNIHLRWTLLYLIWVNSLSHGHWIFLRKGTPSYHLHFKDWNLKKFFSFPPPLLPIQYRNEKRPMSQPELLVHEIYESHLFAIGLLFICLQNRGGGWGVS